MLLAVGVVIVFYQDDNGLGFQGDAPRHAANGAMWLTFIGEPTTDIKDFALRYYARYPTINPVTYPPTFYFVEAIMYALFGVSSFAAKSTVHCFLILGALYVLAWHRRWFGPVAGWLAPLFVLMPGIVRWSNSVMLNAPATMLTIASLYHMHRWLDDLDQGQRRLLHMYLAAAFGVLAVLTYLPAGFLIFVMVVWILARGHWRTLKRPPVIITTIICAAPILAWLIMTSEYTPMHMKWATPKGKQLARMSQWLYYGNVMPQLLSPWLLTLSGIGAVIGLTIRERRRETLYLLVWILVGYVALSMLRAREPRYALPLVMPVVAIAVQGLVSLKTSLALRWPAMAIIVFATLATGSILVATLQARDVPRRRVSGIAAVAEYFKENAPDEPVFYDGRHNGVFTFEVLARDSDRRRRVVLGSKLLYAVALRKEVELEQFADSPEEVIAILRQRGGCRWLAVEKGSESPTIPAAKHLHDALKGPDFEFIRTFPIKAEDIDRIEIYRLLGPMNKTDEVELPFPTLDGRIFKVKPL